MPTKYNLSQLLMVGIAHPTPTIPTSQFRFYSDFDSPELVEGRIPNSHFKSFPLPHSHFPLPHSHFPLPNSHFRIPNSHFKSFPLPTSATPSPQYFVRLFSHLPTFPPSHLLTFFLFPLCLA